MEVKPQIKWLKDVEKKDFVACEMYLPLLFRKSVAGKLAAKLKRTEVTSYAAKDILRACELSLLSQKDPDG